MFDLIHLKSDPETERFKVNVKVEVFKKCFENW